MLWGRGKGDDPALGTPQVLERVVFSMGNLLDKEDVRCCGADTDCLADRGDQGPIQSPHAQEPGTCKGKRIALDALGAEGDEAGGRQVAPPSLGGVDEFTFEEVYTGGLTSPGFRRHGDVSSVDDDEDTEDYGTGILFKTRRDGQMVVAAFVKESDAYLCGCIQDGDQLHSIGSVPISRMSSSQVHSALGGRKDTRVSEEITKRE